LRSDDSHRHDGLDRFFDGQLGRENLLFGKEEKKTLRRDKGGGNKNGHLRLPLEVDQLIRHKAEHIISLLRKFNENSLTERTSFCGREGIGQLFGGSIDILDDWDRFEKAIPPANQFAAQDIRGNQSNQVQQNEEADDSYPREMVYAMEQRDINVWDQGVEDIVEGVEDELQNEKGDPERQDD